MPTILDYETVRRTLSERGYVSLYHNSGAFGFPPEAKVHTVGWIEADDPTIRDAAFALTRRVPSIIELLPAALERLKGDVWLTPKSHWHYELHFGNRELLEDVLTVDVNLLRERNDGSAIAFARSDHAQLVQLVGRLLEGLRGSDFMLAFPDASTLCTIHHHKQLWWQTSDASIHPILVG
jgi:hypothetical protein